MNSVVSAEPSLPISSLPNTSIPTTIPIRRGKPCDQCIEGRAIIQRSATGQKLCKICFLSAFEEEVHQTILHEHLFIPGERIAIGASGGKDSTVLAYVLHKLNKKYNYGVELVLVSVDEGIQGYRDASLERVKDTADELQIPLRIISYQELFGWPMDRVVATTGGRNSCSYCGVFRRQALDKGSVLTNSHKIAIGHNADDVAETALMNLLRGDIARLGRCVKAITGGDIASNTNTHDDDIVGIGGPLPRVKPLITCYEKEIVAYAHHAKLPYHATECSYSPAAYRGFLREMIKDLEAIRPSIIRDIIRAANFWQVDEFGSTTTHNNDESMTTNNQIMNSNEQDDNSSVTSYHTRTSKPSSITTNTSNKLTMKQRVAGVCIRCGYLSSSTLCQACNLLSGLEAGNPRLGLTSGGGGNNPYSREYNNIMLHQTNSKTNEQLINKNNNYYTSTVSERVKQHVIQIKQHQITQQSTKLLDIINEDTNECKTNCGCHKNGTNAKVSPPIHQCQNNNSCKSSLYSVHDIQSIPDTSSGNCCKKSSDSKCACSG